MDARSLKILYVAPLSPNDSSLYRRWALERLGHTIVPLDPAAFRPAGALLEKIVFRAQTGPWVAQLNREVLRLAGEHKPDVLWADKVLALRPATLRELRRLGVVCVDYLSDNPFGPRNDPGWRLFSKCIPDFDLHVVPRDCSVHALMAAGARDAMKIQFAYEPTVHFPPPMGWSDSDRGREVSFIGTPYDERAGFLTKLWKEHGVALSLNGAAQHWRTALSDEAQRTLYDGRELYGGEYREAIWRSKINLSFVTHSNEDEFAHKSFEIAGCGGFLLAERSAGHTARFVEDEEAVFFAGPVECAAKIRRYLPDAAARERVAAAGRARAVRDGYSNDAQEQKVMARVIEILDQRVSRLAR